MAFLDHSITPSSVRLRRSFVPGEQPQAGALRLGEVAVNAADGVIYVGNTDGTHRVVPSGVGITQIVLLTQAEYDAIATKSPTTLYVVR